MLVPLGWCVCGVELVFWAQNSPLTAQLGLCLYLGYFDFHCDPLKVESQGILLGQAVRMSLVIHAFWQGSHCHLMTAVGPSLPNSHCYLLDLVGPCSANFGENWP